MIDVEKQIEAITKLAYDIGAYPIAFRDELRTLLSSAQSGEQVPDVVAAAKALCKHAAKIQNVDFDDYWLIHSEEFKEEARIVIAASQPNGEAA